MDGMYKEANLIASNSTYLKPISDEYIQFYNLDVNSAILTFQVMKDIYPLQIGKANNEMYVYLESENGSYDSYDVENFIDPLNGIIQVNVNDDFLGAATDTWVNGQLYLKAVGRRDTVVLNEFRFYVKDALINKVDSDIKIKYIRQIDRFIEDAKQEIVEAKIGLKSLDNIQVNFDSFISEQKTILNTTIENAKDEMKALSDATQKSGEEQLARIKSQSEDTLTQIEQLTDSVPTNETINEMLTDYVTQNDLSQQLKLKADKYDVTSTNENVPTDIKETVSRLVNESLDELGDSIMPYETDGQLKTIVTPDFETMDFVFQSGVFYAVAPLHTPDLEDSEGVVQIFAYNNNSKVIYWPNGKNEIYIRQQKGELTSDWTDWFNIVNQFQVGNEDSEFLYDDSSSSVPIEDTDKTDETVVISDKPPEDTSKIWIDTTNQ